MHPMHSAQAILTDRALISVTGPDARTYLQGLLTQDVEGLAEGELRYGALLTPQGRLRADLFIHGSGDGVLLDVAADLRGEIVQALTLYRLRAKVQIEADQRTVAAAWGERPDGETWIADPRLAALGWRRIGAADSEGDGDYQAHRIGLGVADPALDGIEPLYPIEANLDLLNGIDFKKGCFVGQETTSRMKRRGQIKTRIVPIAYDGDQVERGTEVLAGELRAGRVLSGVTGRSLALLRLDRAHGADLMAQKRAVRLDPPPWLAPALVMENPPVQA